MGIINAFGLLILVLWTIGPVWLAIKLWRHQLRMTACLAGALAATVLLTGMDPSVVWLAIIGLVSAGAITFWFEWSR